MFFSRSKRLKAELAAAKDKIASLKQEKDDLKSKLHTARERLSQQKDVGIPIDQLNYNADGLCVWGKNLGFLADERFRRAYERGQRSGHKFTNTADDFHVEWRTHVILWAAQVGMKLEGDFVECGVNTGIFSLAIAEYFDFARCGKQFYLFDTFCGTPEEQMSAEEIDKRRRDNQLYYPDCYELAKANFAPYPNMNLVRGRVPDTLPLAPVEKVAYLSIDMNVAEAELAALTYYWDKLVPGAPIILDDYGWTGCESQKAAMDRFSQERQVPIVTLPTGQGLLYKL